MATLAEIHQSVEAARAAGASDIILLKCTSSYPASPEDSNIKTIPHMREAFNVHVGLSDHTMGVGVAVASIALGAVFIEKHFTLSRAEGGVDSAFSLEPHELTSLVVETERAKLGLGKINYRRGAKEDANAVYRRSIFFSKNLPAGHEIQRDDLVIVRPAIGLPPACVDQIVGKKLKVDVNFGTPTHWDMV